MRLLYGLLISIINLHSLHAAPMELINTYWKKLVDTQQGLGDIARYDMVTDLINSKNIWTLVKFKHKPYIFKYDKSLGIWLAHMASPFDGNEKNQTIRIQLDGSLYALCQGIAYRWSNDNSQWIKIADTQLGLPKRTSHLITDVSIEGTAWCLTRSKKRKPSLYYFDNQKNKWLCAATVPVDPNTKNISLRIYSDREVYVIAEDHIVQWNSSRKHWRKIMKTHNGLPNALNIKTDISENGSIWSAVSLKKKPTMLYKYNPTRKLWAPESIMPLNKRKKDQEVRAISDKRIFAVADSTVYKLRK